MARVKRKKVELNVEFLREYMQELYNDTYNYKAQVNAILGKWSPQIKDEGHIAAMGKDIIALMNLLGKTNEQKISLLKILKMIVIDNVTEEKKPIAADSQVPIDEETKANFLKMAEDWRRGTDKNNED